MDPWALCPGEKIDKREIESEAVSHPKSKKRDKQEAKKRSGEQMERERNVKIIKAVSET